MPLSLRNGVSFWPREELSDTAELGSQRSSELSYRVDGVDTLEIDRVPPRVTESLRRDCWDTPSGDDLRYSDRAEVCDRKRSGGASWLSDSALAWLDATEFAWVYRYNLCNSGDVTSKAGHTVFRNIRVVLGDDGLHL